MARFAETLAAAFRIGETGPDVAVLADPTCVHSRRAVAELAERALGGRLRLHVVPVGALGPASTRQAAAIAAAADPVLAWFTEAAPAAPAEVTARTRLSARLLDAWTAEAVPLLLRRHADGGVERHVGRPADPEAWLAATPRDGADTRTGEGAAR